MERIAGKMKLFEGCGEEYGRRHRELWPEMAAELRKHGYHNYSIFLDEETLTLYYYAEVESRELADGMAQTQICRKWWHYMKDLMQTNPDESPTDTPLKEVFHLG